MYRITHIFIYFKKYKLRYITKVVIGPSSITSYFYSNAQDKKVVEIDFETIEIKKTAKIYNLEVEISSNDSSKFHDFVS